MINEIMDPPYIAKVWLNVNDGFWLKDNGPENDTW